jgi:hypothetical protein
MSRTPPRLAAISEGANNRGLRVFPPPNSDKTVWDDKGSQIPPSWEITRLGNTESVSWEPNGQIVPGTVQ